jgi:hypothetical protein
MAQKAGDGGKKNKQDNRRANNDSFNHQDRRTLTPQMRRATFITHERNKEHKFGWHMRIEEDTRN